MGKEQESIDWLPEGWKVEERRRSTGRIDKYFIDPSNKYKFNSKPEVLRFLKHVKSTSQSSALVEIKANTAESTVDLNKESGVTDKGNKSSEHSASESGEKMVAGSQIEQHTINKQIMIRDTSDMKNNNQESMKAAKPKSQKRKNADLPRRASRRIAGIEADHISLEPPTVLTRPRRSAGKNPNNADGDNSADKGKKPADSETPANKPIPEHESYSQNTDLVVESNKQNTEEVIDVPFSELLNDPCIEFAFKTLTGEMPLPIEEDEKPMVEGSSSTMPPEVTANQKPEFPMPTDIPSTLPEVTANQEPEFSMPTDIWADPCFEFAVKTLTGDLPEDTSPVLETVSSPLPSNGVQPPPQARNKQKQIMSSTGTALR